MNCQTAVEILEEDGLIGLETDDAIEALSEMDEFEWKKTYRKVRKKVKNDADLPRVSEVDEWIDRVEETDDLLEEAVEIDRTIFQKGDQVEISHKLEEDLEGELCYDYGKVHRFNGQVWEEIDEAELLTSVSDYSGAKVSESDNKLTLSHNKMKGVVQTFQSRLKCQTEEDFFNDAPPGVAMDNCFVTLDEGQVVTKDPEPFEDRPRVKVDAAYNQTDTPLFDTYLTSIFQGDDMADEKRQTLLEFCGACLMGIAPSFEKAMVLYDNTSRSGGSNGKSVLIKIMSKLLDDDFVSSLPPQDFSEKFSIASLANSRVNLASELPENDIMASDKFKAIITGDPIAAQRKYEDPFVLKPEAGHFFAANKLPRVVSTDDAFWRRWIVMPFNNRFTPEGRPGMTRIKNLDEKIVEQEKGGVISKMIASAAQLVQRGEYSLSQGPEQAKRKWRFMSNPVALFFKQCAKNYTANGPVYDNTDKWRNESDKHISADRLYQIYRKWAKNTGHGTLSMTKFGKRAKELIDNAHTREGRVYRIKMKPEHHMEYT